MILQQCLHKQLTSILTQIAIFIQFIKDIYRFRGFSDKNEVKTVFKSILHVYVIIPFKLILFVIVPVIGWFLFNAYMLFITIMAFPLGLALLMLYVRRLHDTGLRTPSIILLFLLPTTCAVIYAPLAVIFTIIPIILAFFPTDYWK